jgi:hypothetical protein
MNKGEPELALVDSFELMSLQQQKEFNRRARC